MLTEEFFIKYWRDGVEILILWIGIYQIYRAFRGTRGARILVGLVIVLMAVTMLSLALNLEVIGFIMTRVAVGLSLVMVIIFQPELRSALARLGNSRLLSIFTLNKTEGSEFLETLVDAVKQMSSKRYGALIAIERRNDLEEQRETGVKMDSAFSPELALTVFHPKTALHDGGMILSSGRISTAGCVFPVSHREMSDRTLGLRHRAAVGLTEETDAVAIVVSEETGRVSFAIEGELRRLEKGEDILKVLQGLFLQEDQKEEDDETLASEDSGSIASNSSVVSD